MYFFIVGGGGKSGENRKVNVKITNFNGAPESPFPVEKRPGFHNGKKYLRFSYKESSLMAEIRNNH